MKPTDNKTGTNRDTRDTTNTQQRPGANQNQQGTNRPTTGTQNPNQKGGGLGTGGAQRNTGATGGLGGNNANNPYNKQK
jgi:hypothetical protein